MTKAFKRFTDIARPIYLALLVVFTLLREVVPLGRIVGSDIFAYIFFGAGVIVIGLNFLFNRKMFRVPSIGLLVAFIGVCALSTLINGFAFVNNLKTIGWLAIFFFVLFVSGANSEKNKERDLSAIFISAVATMGVLTLVSFIMYVYDIDYTYFNFNLVGVNSNQGFSHQFMRLWGVFLENNYASTYGLVTLFMGVYLFKKYRNVAARIAIVLSAFFTFSFMVLTNSRTVQVVSSVAIAWVVFYSIASMVKARKWVRAVIAPLAALVSMVAVIFIFYIARMIYPPIKVAIRNVSGHQVTESIHRGFDELYRFGDILVLDGYLPEKPVEVPNDDDSDKQEPDVEPDDEPDNEQNGDSDGDFEEKPEIIKPEALDRTDLGKSDVSNGRFLRWREGFEVFKRTPIIGTSPRGIRDFAIKYMPESRIARFNYSILNYIIEIMATTGIIGLAIVLILFIKTLRIILLATFKQPFDKKILCIGAVALTLAVASMFQTDLFFNMAFGGVAFWSAMGVLNSHKVKEHTHGSDCERVLVYGLKDPAGGVEHVVLEYVREMTKKHNIKFDFIYFTSCSLAPELESLGCRVLHMPSRKRRPISYKRALARVFEQNDYIAVWGNYSGLTNIDLLTYAYRYDVPVRIAHSHVNRLYCDGLLMKLFVNVTHRLNKFVVTDVATHYFACSEIAGKFMFPQKVHGDIIVCKNAVDITRFYPDVSDMRKVLGIADDTYVVTHVARMCEAKNQPFLLEVFSEVIKKRDNSVLLMVGDGEKRQEIEQKAAALGITDKIKFLGERGDVPEILRISDVFVLPSLSEGLGLVAIEAQSCAIPCVVSDAVPRDVDISGAVKFVSLADSAEKWADAVIGAESLTVCDAVDCVKKHGYDIASQSETVYNIFKG